MQRHDHGEGKVRCCSMSQACVITNSRVFREEANYVDCDDKGVNCLLGQVGTVPGKIQGP